MHEVVDHLLEASEEGVLVGEAVEVVEVAEGSIQEGEVEEEESLSLIVLD
jgi:hypothetical protein